MGKDLGKCVFAFVGQTNPLRRPPLSGKEGEPRFPEVKWNSVEDAFTVCKGVFYFFREVEYVV